MHEPVVACGGRRVDDHLRPVGDLCGRRFRAPGLVPPEAGYVVFSPLSPELRPPTVDEVVERARAGGWAVPDGQDPDGGQLVGTCPTCRRPAPEVVALVKERKQANRRRGT